MLTEERRKAHARSQVAKAIKDGKLVRQNCQCGKVSEAHHDDYDKPLDVKWLCRSCHSQYHHLEWSMNKNEAKDPKIIKLREQFKALNQIAIAKNHKPVIMPFADYTTFRKLPL